MEPKISHDRSLESAEAKTLWFRSLDLSDRMEYLCDITDLILENRPDMQAATIQEHVESAPGRVRVLELPRR